VAPPEGPPIYWREEKREKRKKEREKRKGERKG
jgi:hypothetical protein